MARLAPERECRETRPTGVWHGRIAIPCGMGAVTAHVRTRRNHYRIRVAEATTTQAPASAARKATYRSGRRN